MAMGTDRRVFVAMECTVVCLWVGYVPCIIACTHGTPVGLALFRAALLYILLPNLITTWAMLLPCVRRLCQRRVVDAEAEKGPLDEGSPAQATRSGAAPVHVVAVAVEGLLLKTIHGFFKGPPKPPAAAV